MGISKDILNIAELIYFGYIFTIALNVLYITPNIEKITEYEKGNKSYTMSKKLRWYIFFFGVFCYLFLNRIRNIRKNDHYELDLKSLKNKNINGKNNNIIQQLERSLKIKRLKKKL
jgi:hypothetical protein